MSDDQDSLELMASVYSRLVSNPETREQTLRLVKKANPNMMIPEIDAKDAVVSQVQALEAKLAKSEEDRAREKVLAGLEKQKEQLLARPGWKSEDIDACEKMMIEKGIANYATAADFYDMQRQAATPGPTPESQSPYSLGITAEDLKNPDAWSRKVAHEAINELNSARARGVQIN